MSSSGVDISCPPRPKARFLSVRGLRIRVLEAGQGRPILLIHGGVGSADDWRNLIDVLARRGFRAIAFDLPGFGLSTAPGEVAYFGERLPFYPQLVRDLLKRLDAEPIILIGHSLGGMIAAVTAVCFPALVERLVLISPGGVGDRLGLLTRVGAVPLAARLLRHLPALLFRCIISGAFCDGRSIPRSLRQRWWQHLRHDVKPLRTGRLHEALQPRGRDQGVRGQGHAATRGEAGRRRRIDERPVPATHARAAGSSMRQ